MAHIRRQLKPGAQSLRQVRFRSIRKSGVLVAGGITEQAAQALNNLKAVLEEAGAALSDVVKTSVFLSGDMNDFAKVNGIYAGFFAAPYPAPLLRRGIPSPEGCPN